MPEPTCNETLNFLTSLFSEVRDSLTKDKYDIIAQEESSVNPVLSYFLDPGIDTAITNADAMISLLADNREIICESGGLTVNELIKKYKPYNY